MGKGFTKSGVSGSLGVKGQGEEGEGRKRRSERNKKRKSGGEEKEWWSEGTRRPRGER